MSALPAFVALLSAAVAALCAAADGALVSIDLAAADAPDAAERARGRERSHRVLSFARVVAQLATGAATAVALRLDQRPTAEAVMLGLAAALAAMLLADTLARSVGDALGARAARALEPVTRVAWVLLAPAVAISARLDAALLRAFPPTQPSERDRESSHERFRQVVSAEAEVTRRERALLNGVFAMGDTSVADIMVPRVDVVGIDHETPWSEVLDRVRSSEHARFPVYAETIDDVTGILYAKDLLAPVLADQEPEAGWLSLVRSAQFIPRTKTIDAQLRDFKASRTHIAIVVDEYGGTAGLVTIEDILEEIVGEIRDEYDVEDPPIEQEEGRRFWVSARVTLEELSELVGHDFKHEEVATVGGLVYELLGRVPRAGEEFTYDNFRVVVERVVGRRVQRVYFERLSPVPEEQSA
jgi:CBS domain containing-hemolysin-like protein